MKNIKNKKIILLITLILLCSFSTVNAEKYTIDGMDFIVGEHKPKERVHEKKNNIESKKTLSKNITLGTEFIEEDALGKVHSDLKGISVKLENENEHIPLIAKNIKPQKKGVISLIVEILQKILFKIESLLLRLDVVEEKLDIKPLEENSNNESEDGINDNLEEENNEEYQSSDNSEANEYDNSDGEIEKQNQDQTDNELEDTDNNSDEDSDVVGGDEDDSENQTDNELEESDYTDENIEAQGGTSGTDGSEEEIGDNDSDESIDNFETETEM